MSERIGLNAIQAGSSSFTGATRRAGISGSVGINSASCVDYFWTKANSGEPGSGDHERNFSTEAAA
jgi:hypothetical protein